MTPQERQLVADLFERLASLERNQRDPDAERAITQGLARAPGAVYPLVQTVLVQDEALKRADARIRELEGGGEAPSTGGFLDNMRDALTGRRGSVPAVRPGATDTRWNNGGALAPAQQPAGQPSVGQPSVGHGGSFLGTAAAAAAGVIGGSLLLNSIGSMFGNRSQAFAGSDQPGSSPWSGNAAGSDLAREAGADNIGRNTGAGLLDTNNASDTGFDSGGDFGGGDSGGGD